MKATELRIGNWVEWSELASMGFGRVQVDVKNLSYSQLLKPIPLTEELLLKFGFVKDNNGNYWIDLKTHYLQLMPSRGYWYPVYAQAPEMSQEEEQRVSTNRIDCVHSLQNLYFALTNTELILKND